MALHYKTAAGSKCAMSSVSYSIRHTRCQYFELLILLIRISSAYFIVCTFKGSLCNIKRKHCVSLIIYSYLVKHDQKCIKN